MNVFIYKVYILLLYDDWFWQCKTATAGHAGDTQHTPHTRNIIQKWYSRDYIEIQARYIHYTATVSCMPGIHYYLCLTHLNLPNLTKYLLSEFDSFHPIIK